MVLGYCDGNAHLAIDVSCTRLITNSNLASASTSPGEALEAAEEDKRAKYAAQLAAAQGAIHFVPFMVDEFGGIGDHERHALGQLHSYDTPEWIHWQASSDGPYGRWLLEQLALSPGGGPPAPAGRPGAGDPAG